MVAFCSHLIALNQQTVVNENSKNEKISLQAFNKFVEIVMNRKGDFCNAKQLVLECREVFKVKESIHGVIYANSEDVADEPKSTDKMN